MTELITYGIKNPTRFWKSVSKQKTLKMCDLKFKLKYIDFLEGAPQSEVALVGSLIHEAWSETLKEGIDDLWFNMETDELQKLFYHKYRNQIENHKDFVTWNVLFENNVTHLSEFERTRFMTFFSKIKGDLVKTKVWQEEDALQRRLKTGDEMMFEAKELMKDYFLPVATEVFMKNGLYLYNFIADAIFRIHKTGDPAKDLEFMIFDLKAGSAQPSEVRSDDKGQVTTYSIFWNSVIDNPIGTSLALQHLKGEMILLKTQLDVGKGVSDDATIKFFEKEFKSAKKNYELTKESNELITNLKGRILYWGILYLGNKTLHFDEIKKVSKTYAFKRITKMAEKIESNIQTGEWKNVWGKACWFTYFDKISDKESDFKCDFYDHCWKKNNQDLAWDD